ncbi:MULTISPECIES: flagellar filament capping protein FliD [unclassified Geodermatophilus]
MSVDGLVSGLDTTSLISQLVQAEAAPQAQLKTKLSVTNASATAYRTINTRFDAVRTAAEALTKPEAWSAARATSSSSTVTATTGTAPQTGTVTFAVTQLATAHSVRSTATWSTTTADFGATSISVAAGGTTTAVALDTDGNGTATLAEAAAAINKKPELGLTATVLQTGPGEYRLQVTTKSSGAAGSFSLSGGPAFVDLTKGQNAVLHIGGATDGFDVTSTTNTFTDLIPGTSITVSKADKDAAVTVDVAADPQAVAGKVKALVDAVNNALSGIKTYTAADGGATAVLKGDSGLSALASSLRSAVSYAVGGDGSPNRAGIQLNRDGTVTFDQERFVAALKADPGLARRIVDGSPAAGTAAAVPGVADRVLELAQKATDTTTGTLTMLAKGRDALAKDIQTRIDAWDLRLAQRKQTLTRQFTAMETALSAMKNQSNWLAGQIASLPSSS